MKAIQVIGYKNSGKSSLIIQLAKHLKKRGYAVCVLKHAHHLTMPEKDEKILQEAERYLITSETGSILYISSFLQFLQATAFLNADFLIIEGYKEHNFIPRVVCWKNEEERKELATGMEIGNCGLGEWKNEVRINELIEVIEKRAFLLPGIDCGKCDFGTCHEMAGQILAEKKRLEDCVALSEDTKVIINGNQVALSPFVAHIMKQTFGGFLKSLKGVVSGKAIIEIDIEP
ncbi:MAG: hypothetical protein A2Y62_16930 [Candidatus Fischerbacteria bacterium RBG_13_37_8]|uniref:4Fe-4S domain-containing protein n=1 Tax=Candidatus Fischerbacteria bacterium RBG_13_37_8 TaxID=1817863 RepID=A0A1F5VDT1_9BACT|nr:MAG: hypothetical protein A2Y62_16930 [Candidatus Fischerbacteria bacterium RBG_13_37_8]